MRLRWRTTRGAVLPLRSAELDCARLVPHEREEKREENILTEEMLHENGTHDCGYLCNVGRSR